MRVVYDDDRIPQDDRIKSKARICFLPPRLTCCEPEQSDTFCVTEKRSSLFLILSLIPVYLPLSLCYVQ